mmetsp:Transcript_21823/g.38951  ORF Transcript_21823/g.38951 Transcript_21823/m.38951 type:complete len:117 (-) Transcript_21823:112-462(-)
MDADKTKIGVEEPVALNRIRIALTSKSVKDLEKVAADFIKSAKKDDIKTKGPIRMPTRVLKVTTRKGPSGQGTNTFDCFEMRIHKRVLYFKATIAAVSKITSSNIEPGVEVEVVAC